MSWTLPRTVAHILSENHYLGPLYRGIAWQDEYGVIIVTAPTARHIPTHWLELARWCITSKVKNAGIESVPTKRNPLRTDWPEHLYCRRGYFTWRHPVTRREYGLGRDEAAAREAAEEANRHIQKGLLERISEPRRTFGAAARPATGGTRQRWARGR